ncbi:MAG: hypothetical protein KDA62_21530, partial [Planctomycetales bacterium]|nr:hypothetical protein [Planctomycetales bacterium]
MSTRSRRRLFLESLQARLPLSASPFEPNDIAETEGSAEIAVESSHHHRAERADVNDDSTVSPVDALLLINALNQSNAAGAAAVDAVMFDVNNDGLFSPADVMSVISRLNEDQHGLNDDPATHDANDDKGVDDPATHDVNDDKGVDVP